MCFPFYDLWRSGIYWFHNVCFLCDSDVLWIEDHTLVTMMDSILDRVAKDCGRRNSSSPSTSGDIFEPSSSSNGEAEDPKHLIPSICWTNSCLGWFSLGLHFVMSTAKLRATLVVDKQPSSFLKFASKFFWWGVMSILGWWYYLVSIVEQVETRFYTRGSSNISDFTVIRS